MSMSFLDLAKERYSLRHYAAKNVEDEKLDAILEAGRLAPTGCNYQPQKIYVLKSEEAMEKARKATKMVYDAPMAMLVCWDSEISWKNTPETFGEEYYDGGEVDAAIVCTHMMMEATELGVQSLWIRGFNKDVIREVFELPEHIHPVCLLALGYAKEGAGPNKKLHYTRRPLEETVEIL